MIVCDDLYLYYRLIMSKEWNLTGNKDLLSVKNPLRHLCEITIPEINKELKEKVDPNRPTEPINVSYGDPVAYENFKYFFN